MAAALVSSNLVKSWDKAGKADILKLCRSTIQKSNQDQGHEITGTQRLFHQLVWLGIAGQAKPSEVSSLLKEAVDGNTELISLLADVVTVADTETTCLDDRLQRDRFVALVSCLDVAVPQGILRERLEPDTLESASLIPSQKILNQKLVRTKTKLFYKQQKFNLLREESEGYAKLITELSKQVTSSSNATHALETIKSLIGFFNLDPNRVLDILLEAFECQVEHDDFYIPLIRSYLEHCDVSGFCHLVGFKFQYYNRSGENDTPMSLYKMTSLLLKNDMLLLDDLYPHLQPSDSEIIKENKKMVSSAKEAAIKLNAVSLSDQKEDESKETESSEDDIHVDNQKFGLCHAMLELGSWKEAVELMDRLPPYSLLSIPKIARSLCHLIHCTIEPLYRSKFSPRAAVGEPYKSKRGFPEPCLQYTQLPDYTFPMLSKLGAYLSIDPILHVKVGRIAKGFLKEYNQSSELLKERMRPVWAGVLTLIDEVLFPSLSILECNCGIAEELWGLLKRFPYDVRYRLYARWKNASYSSHPRLILAKAQTIKRAKYITKRLSKENVKPSGRQIGKLSHSNPGILFDHLLAQIERYNNFIGPMVDALKYLNPLAYDVLAFCIIEALANPAKERMKQSDTNLSDWLQSLSQFCGAVFKKYPTEITGLLQYITNQLKAGKSLDLLVLKEVVQKMTGVESNDEITPHQLEALSGGDLLKSEGAYFGQIRNTRKPSQRLRDGLMEGNLTIPLCLLIAQQRNGIVYVEETTRHLKLVGKLYDQCQDNLIQFGGFLTTQLTTHDYQASLPSLDELHQVFGITPDVSFFLTRPIYKFEIQTKEAAFRQILLAEKDNVKQQELERGFADTCDDIFRPVVEAAIPLQSPKIWNNLSPLLYVSFWSMSMYDLYCPVERYKLEVGKLKTTMQEVDDNKEITSTSKKKKEKERCQFLIEKMEEEMRMQQSHNKLMKKWLETRKDAWFPSQLAKGETITQFLQLCIFPRCVFSAIDAIYCAKFIQTIHTLQTPNFSTLICFDRIFSDISYIVASLTENEASRYGRFLCAMLQMVMRWHADKELYEKECAKYPGFLTVLRAANSDKASLLGFENFRHVCHKWQYKLTKAVVVCLESKDYTQIRNTILVLIKILPHYPQVKNLGQAVERRVDKIIEDEKDKRHDLQALAIGYNGMLKRKSDMVPENQFHQKDKEKVEIKNAKPTVKQEASDESTTRASVKREDVEDLSTNSDSHTKPSKSDTSVARSDRERSLVEEESNDRKRAQSGSPKNSSSSSNKNSDSKDRAREKSKDRLRDSKEKDKRRSRTVSPSSGSEDMKKRRMDEDGFHSPNATKAKDKSKNDRKRSSMDNNLDIKDSKRKKEEIDLTNSNSDKMRKDAPKKDKVKSKDKSVIREDFKPSKKESKTDGRKDKDSRDEEKSKKHKSSKMKDR